MTSPQDKPKAESSEHNDAELAAGARAAMERREQSLDGETLSRLRRARSAALDGAADTSRPGWMLWLPTGLAGAAAVLTVALFVGQERSSSQGEPVDMLADAWILNEDAELDMIEDVEFYQWLAEEALDGHSS
ncbi:hypothetical protein [Microbulbifer agarilyticus]|uniref:DUF3619 domain-containing protein n=1 Tax=Microbulbifer agarilyticus TaxID=260552 RepID=A0A1Q2M6B0_9GAMM|nr:hypothetical protein [Microbulbifer agarilyticus]AQQ68189.1 hypothetical protein Mag101_11485 [Microbulbifer agarilyticus]